MFTQHQNQTNSGQQMTPATKARVQATMEILAEEQEKSDKKFYGHCCSNERITRLNTGNRSEEDPFVNFIQKVHSL